jgi:hypothetical protein
MVKGIVPDANIEGHFAILMRLLGQQPWVEFWAHLNLRTPSFADLGLPADSPDLLVWQTCEREEMILVTANRNQEGPESLETAIRTLNIANSLPVMTLADADRIRHEQSYAERVVERLIIYLLDIDRYRGAGRLYLP